MRGLEKVPYEVGGEALTVGEPARDVNVIEGVGEAGLDHDERGGEHADREERQRYGHEPAAQRATPIRSVRPVRR